jgi:hypothetical protein
VATGAFLRPAHAPPGTTAFDVIDVFVTFALGWIATAVAVGWFALAVESNQNAHS